MTLRRFASSSRWRHDSWRAWREGCEEGARQEREAIVAWLRRRAEASVDYVLDAAHTVPDALNEAARLIEEGKAKT